jgi:hypothetical protein
MVGELREYHPPLPTCVVMHNFWAMEQGLQRARETRNFIRNMAIMAGLLVATGLIDRPLDRGVQKQMSSAIMRL